jgi:hypothetical protein
MQIKAKIVRILPLQTGNGRSGEWRKQDIIVETIGQYLKTICISIWGDKIKEEQLIIGIILKVDLEIESREYNGRWYTDVKAWRIDSDLSEISSNPISNSNSIEDNLIDSDDIVPF